MLLRDEPPADYEQDMLKCLNYEISRDISKDLRLQMALEVTAGELLASP